MTRDIRFDAVRTWVFDQALPFWAANALDEPGLGFLEQLDLDGGPREPGFKRVRTQARQIYAFSHAHLLGWAGPCRDLADAGMAFVQAHAALPGGGWARTLARGGEVIDPTFDLYDQAFVLYALAWRHRAFADPAAVEQARATLDALEQRLGHDRGFRAADPDPGPLEQNPHMHLLEASLA